MTHPRLGLVLVAALAMARVAYADLAIGRDKWILGDYKAAAAELSVQAGAAASVRSARRGRLPG